MKNYRYLMIALLTLGFTACQQEEDFAPQAGGEQELRIATRSTEGGSNTQTFTDDFALELWSTDDATKHQTYQMSHNGTDWNTVISNILPAHAFAYRGKSVTAITYTDEWDYTVTLQLDQTDAAKLADADVMTATGEASAESPLDLNFRHIFAKVTFNATLASEFGEEDEITSLAVMTADEKTVNAYVDGETVSAIITPGAYTAGNDFLSVTMSGADNPLTVKVPAVGLTFTAGTHYTFNLKVGKDRMAINSVSVAEWGNGGETDKVVAEECTHSWNHDDEYSVCTICGLDCTIHHWVDGVCSECGKEETQNN